MTWNSKGQPVDWISLMCDIASGNALAMEELYARVFAKGIRYFLLRNLGLDELDDRVHNCFITVIDAIQAGKIREPQFIQSYAWMVAKGQVALAIRRIVYQRAVLVRLDLAIVLSVPDRHSDPERVLMARERKATARQAMARLSPRDREVLIRVYYDEQSKAAVCIDMCLTVRQLTLLKSRALARFGKLGRKIMRASLQKLATPITAGVLTAPVLELSAEAGL